MLRIAVISFSNLTTDARSFNLIKTLAEENELVTFSMTPEIECNQLLPNTFNHSISVDFRRSSKSRWLEFHRKFKQHVKSLHKVDIVVASDLYALLSARYLSKVYKSKLFYDSREIYSALGPLSNSKMKQAVITVIEKYLIRSVDEFVVSGDLDAEYLKEHLKTTKPFHTILNLPPTKPIISNTKLRLLYPNIKDKTILIYQGVVLDGRGILPAIKAVEKDKSLALVIIGNGDKLEFFNQIVKNLRLEERVCFVGEVPYNELHDYTCSADIGLSIIEPISLSYQLALPNKMFEYVRAGIPQIATSLPAMQKIIEKHEIGVCIENPESSEEILDAILTITSKKSFFLEKVVNAAKVFNYDNQKKQIKSKFQVLK